MAESNNNILGWIAAAIVVLLIWGNLSRKSKSHPLNKVKIDTQLPVNTHTATGGDSFCSGDTFTPGVSEPHPSMEIPSQQTAPVSHIMFPVDPPPIAIQTPKPPVFVAPQPKPVTPKPPIIAPMPGPPVSLPTPPTVRTPVFRAPTPVTNVFQKKTGPRQVYLL